ncbi:MAG: DNA polymerase I, partial [Desulfovibrionaceae bacterium]|nr:DNA polymerase I [Desulfovibrionaceae bacterium]
LRLLVSEGCEADDCIASLALRHRDDGGVVIVGADKDLKQCLHERVLMWDPGGRDGKITTLESFRAETGLEPASWPDVQAVIGDSSDNIPGIPGVGIKTAETLFQSFSSLEDIRDRYEELKPALKKKIAGHLDAAFLYRQLTRLDTGRCQDVSEEDFAVRPVDVKEVSAILREFELTALEREISGLIGSGKMTAAAAKPGMQGTLFAMPKAMERAKAETPADLPDAAFFAGKDVALMLDAESLTIAAEGREWSYIGPFEPLAGLFARSAALHPGTRFVVPDVKKFLHSHNAWRSIPMARWFDLGLAAYLLDPEQADYAWPRLSGEWSTELNMSPANPGLLALAMAQALRRRLEAAGLTALLQGMEIPLTAVLADMEDAGVQLDAERLSQFLEDVRQELEQLTEEIYRAAGGPFNIRSAQQLGEVLFTRLRLPAAKKTQGGQASTSKDVLDGLSGKHPVVDALRKYRVLEKLRSTYLEPLPRLMGADGRIRTTFNQTATATGRLSSSNPNLQNIPVRGEQGRKMRGCFTAPEGKLIVSADYSQIELRVLACVSQDPELLRAFREGADIHARTAGLLYDVPADRVSPDQRRAAKTINFGLIYGMGAQKLAHELGISTAEARAFITRYFERLGTLQAFYEQVKEEARERGYVTTLAGRRRLLPGIHSASGQVRAMAERQAVNTVIQGSAADIIKLAMLAVARDARLSAMRARLLLQIHDELLLEVPEAEAAAAGARVAEIMSSVMPGGRKMDIPLLVEWGTGHSWGEAH